MAIIRWQPRQETWDPFASLQDLRAEMHRLFDSSMHHRGETWDNAFNPAMDVIEEKDNFLVKMDLPGLAKEDVNVSIQDKFLTIRGERKHEVEQKETNYFHREIVNGSFTRLVELPAQVDPSKIVANFKDGVLQVTLPKSEAAKPKEIKVNVS